MANHELELPDEFADAPYEAALEIDQLLGRGGSPSDEAFHAHVLAHRDHVFNHLTTLGRQVRISIGDLGPDRLGIGWPSWLYIPAAADWRNHWVVPPDDAQRFALDWAPPPSPAGYSEASRDEGRLYCIQRIRTTDRSVKSEAGLGILFSPERTLSVVSLQPYVDCSGDSRWYQMIDQPVAGSTHVKISLFVAGWQQTAGTPGWERMQAKRFHVHDVGPNSGSGATAITPWQRSFAGSDLATAFLVEKARTYLLGVVARVSVSSTLTDDRGNALPLIEDGTFRVWGSITCRVPRIELHEQQVHIP